MESIYVFPFEMIFSTSLIASVHNRLFHGAVTEGGLVTGGVAPGALTEGGAWHRGRGSGAIKMER